MRNKYTISEFVSTVYALIITRLFYREARLIRRPFYIRGKSSFRYGKGLTTGHGCRFDLLGNGEKTLYFGRNCEIGDNVHIVALEQVKIGDNCLMASKIFISDTSHGDYSIDSKSSSPSIAPNDRPLIKKPVSIGNNVWIGENVCILLGVTIGNGCIIGANTVVNRDVPENTIVVGSPAKVIKRWDKDLGKWLKVVEQ
jgi:acetyltransferase-like isoleucine patch superfamily enzyme